MRSLIQILIMLIISVATALFVGKTTIETKTITIERPYHFAGALMIMIGACLMFMGDSIKTD